MSEQKPTEAEIARIKEIFDKFDLDHSGDISTSELSTVLKSLGQNYTIDELKEIVASVDIDGSGTIDFNEFVNLVMLQRENAKREQELKQAFSVFDRDGNGYISCAELKFVMQTLCPDITEEEAHGMIAEGDCDGDGQISYEEFAKLINKC